MNQPYSNLMPVFSLDTRHLVLVIPIVILLTVIDMDDILIELVIELPSIIQMLSDAPIWPGL
jgi:hypothetical protein